MPDRHRIALVTGANKGTGFEIARQLLAEGVIVLVGARNADRGKAAVEQLNAAGSGAILIELDTSDPASIAVAADTIEAAHGGLDILVNNVGVWDRAGDGVPSKTALSVIRETLEVNFIGMVAVTQAMLPLLRRSDAGRIVNVSSTLGSLDVNGDPSNPYYASQLIGYNASKAAVNMLTVQLAQELKGTSIVVNSVSPGYAKTDFTGGEGIVTADEAATAPVRYALLGEKAVSGQFVDANGQISW